MHMKVSMGREKIVAKEGLRDTPRQSGVFSWDSRGGHFRSKS